MIKSKFIFGWTNIRKYLWRKNYFLIAYRWIGEKRFHQILYLNIIEIFRLEYDFDGINNLKYFDCDEKFYLTAA
jgi:hypothetical protein